MPRKIHTAWTQHLKGESKTRFQEQLLSNHALFERLDQLLEEFKQDPTQKDYGEPSWAYKQAHINGKNEGYSHIQKIIRTLIEE